MVEKQLEYDLDRFQDLPDGPTVSIHGEVRWPKGWTTSDKKAWIQMERSIHKKLHPERPISSNGNIAVLEYDLDPVGDPPDYLSALREANPNAEWLADPETFAIQEETTTPDAPVPDAPVSAHDVVADILEQYYSMTKNCGPMTRKKLQKLVYYCQAQCLALDIGPLFGETIEAWKQGPVVRELYYRGPTIRDLEQQRRHHKGDPKRLSAKQQGVVDFVLKHYGPQDSEALSELTHDERPWRAARKRENRKDGQHGQEIITHEDMKEYYSTRMPPQ